MSKVRIYELAKQLKKSNKEVIDFLAGLGLDGKTHSSSIENAVAQRVIKELKAPPPKPAEPKSAQPVAARRQRRREEARTVQKKPEPGPKKIEAVRPVAVKPAQEAAPKKARCAHRGGQEDHERHRCRSAARTEAAPAEAPAQPGTPAVAGEDEEKVLDRFKKDVEAEKIEKFKAKPGLQRAFQSIRKIEPRSGM